MLLFHIDLNFVCLREDYLRTWIRRLADMGYTGLVWELEDKVRWETCPECVWPEALTKDALAGLLAEARSLGLENIPLLQTIGHAEYVLKHEPYAAWRENPDSHDCYCTSRPEVRDFLKRWINEYLDLFGEVRYFHLGGDEAYEFGKCPVCRERAAAIGHNRLYSEHIHDLAQPILARGVRPGIWCDMLLKHPEQMGDVPRDFVIWDWNYWDGDRPPRAVRTWSHGSLTRDQITPELRALMPELVDAAGELVPFYTSDLLARQGLDVVVCSASRSHGDSTYIGQHEPHAPNVVGGALKARSAGLLGTLVTSWAIRVHPLEVQWPCLKMAALAYHEGLDCAAAERRMARELFGLDDDRVGRLLRLLGHPVPFACRNEAGIQWCGWKDPVPAPPGLVERLLTRWREGDGALLAAKQAELAEAEEQIAEGTALLAELTAEAAAGRPILAALARAALCQGNAVRVARAILSGQGRDAAAATHRETKTAFEDWARSWMTPVSAELVAALAHDEVAAYLAMG